MKIRNIEDCFKFRLLRKIKPDKEKSKLSLKISEERLNRAKEAVELKFFEFAVLEAYMAMFHAARALLYCDGIQEKSHFALYLYLKEKYSDKIPLYIINFLNIHRIERHEALYGFEYKPKKDDALTAIEDAEIFVKEVKKALKESCF